MSNPLYNLHIEYGEPCGDSPDFDQISSWAASMIESPSSEIAATLATKDAEIARLKADLHASDELVQRLAEALASEVCNSFYYTNDPRELDETDRKSAAKAAQVLENLGLRKVEGRWVRVK